MKYPKIQTIFKRDPASNYKSLLKGEYSIYEFEYLANNEWVFTEKIDGTNIRVYWDCNTVRFEGRTDKAQIPSFLLDKLKEVFTKFHLEYLEVPMVLYGEGYGAKIGKGGGNYICDGVDFILFDVLINSIWLVREGVEDIASHLGIKVVPIIGSGSILDAVHMARCGFKSKIGLQDAEGIVLRPKVELITRTGNRIIAKIKTKDFQR